MSKIGVDLFEPQLLVTAILALTKPGVPVVIATASTESELKKIDNSDLIETQLQEIEGN